MKKLKSLLIEAIGGPESKAPEDIAKYIKDRISPDMTEEDIIPLIRTAIAEWASRQQSLGFYKTAKISTMVQNITQYNEDYIPDVFDALIKMRVKYDRLSNAKKQHPDLFKNNPDLEKKFQ